MVRFRELKTFNHEVTTKPKPTNTNSIIGCQVDEKMVELVVFQQARRGETAARINYDVSRFKLREDVSNSEDRNRFIVASPQRGEMFIAGRPFFPEAP